MKENALRNYSQDKNTHMWENFKRASKLIFLSNMFMMPVSVGHSLHSVEWRIKERKVTLKI